MEVLSKKILHTTAVAVAQPSQKIRFPTNHNKTTFFKAI